MYIACTCTCTPAHWLVLGWMVFPSALECWYFLKMKKCKCFHLEGLRESPYTIRALKKQYLNFTQYLHLSMWTTFNVLSQLVHGYSFSTLHAHFSRSHFLEKYKGREWISTSQWWTTNHAFRLTYSYHMLLGSSSTQYSNLHLLKKHFHHSLV